MSSDFKVLSIKLTQVAIASPPYTKCGHNGLCELVTLKPILKQS